MTREQALDIITPRQFVEELQGLDPANMKYDTISFPVNTDRIDCSFRIFDPIFMNGLLENNETIYAVLESDNLTFQEKLEYLNGLKHIVVQTKILICLCFIRRIIFVNSIISKIILERFSSNDSRTSFRFNYSSSICRIY